MHRVLREGVWYGCLQNHRRQREVRLREIDRKVGEIREDAIKDLLEKGVVNPSESQINSRGYSISVKLFEDNPDERVLWDGDDRVGVLKAARPRPIQDPG